MVQEWCFLRLHIPATCDNSLTRMKPESLSVDLESLSITPELLAQHSITPDEYLRIVAALGRAPWTD